MRATREFIIEATQTHEDKSEGGILLLHRFENQSKVIQYHKIVAVPEKYKHMAEVGDTLICHFNVIVYDRKDGVVKKSPYIIEGDLFRVPNNMIHFVIKKSGQIMFFEDDCLIEGKFTKDDIVRDSGIIMPDLRKDNEKKNGLMEGTVFAKCEAMHDVEVGAHVGLSKYSDYSIKLPDGSTKWFVNEASVLFEYED